MIDILKPLIKQFMPFAQKQMGFDRVPSLFLKDDETEANNPMGKTGFYDPQNESITIYIGKRHPKDIMRSLSHELMHHAQNCNGEFDQVSNLGEEGYAQTSGHLRKMEIQAYQASIVFRDWEDSTKGTIYYEHLQKGENKMSTKDWKNGELTTILSEAFGFKFNIDALNEDIGGAGGELTDDEAKEEEGDDPYTSKREKEGNLEEDSGEEEGKHYRDNTMNDDDHIKAIEHHLDALKHDRDYDEDHIDENQEPDLDEAALGSRQGGDRAKKQCEKQGKKMVAGKCVDPETLEESPSHPADDREGNRATGRRVKKKGQRVEEDFPGKRDMDQHKRDLSEKAIRKLVQKALKEALAKRGTKDGNRKR
mgnify:CR=1 FL=1|tara:strand:+ start:4739 stop:5833 length:1095 start_codon:yes stop_codon:yes gene_type:complete